MQQINSLGCVGQSCTFRHESVAWIIPWKQLTRPWHFSSALLLPTVWNDHKNLFFPRPCFFPGEFLRVCQILGPFSQAGHRLEILLNFTMRELEKRGSKVRWPRPSLFEAGLMSSQGDFGLAEAGMVFSKCAVLFWTSRVFLQPSLRSP